MPCVTSDGSLTPVAAQVLAALAAVGAPGAADAVARAAVLPVYRVRSALRELQQAGLIKEADGGLVLSATGREKLALVSAPHAGKPAHAPSS